MKYYSRMRIYYYFELKLNQASIDMTNCILYAAYEIMGVINFIMNQLKLFTNHSRFTIQSNKSFHSSNDQIVTISFSRLMILIVILVHQNHGIINRNLMSITVHFAGYWVDLIDYSRSDSKWVTFSSSLHAPYFFLEMKKYSNSRALLIIASGLCG